MLIKGIFEYEIGGKKRGFKFGMLASDYFCQEENITLAQMQDRLLNPTPKTAINCAYAAARAYCESKEIDIDFKRADVADWLDEIGVIKFFESIYKTLEVYQEPEAAEEKNA